MFIPVGCNDVEDFRQDQGDSVFLAPLRLCGKLKLLSFE